MLACDTEKVHRLPVIMASSRAPHGGEIYLTGVIPLH
jgi:hypothetical protein